MTESTATGAASVGLSPDRIAQDPKAGPQQTLTVLYLMSVNVLKLPGATPEQMVIGDGAARALQEFVPNFFTAANKPAGATDAAWTEGRTTMEKVAKDTLMILATKPGFEALNRYGTNKDVKECVIAEDSYRKALQQYPDRSIGQGVAMPAGVRPRQRGACPEFARAAALDPTLGGTMDPKALNTYLESAYTSFHGSLAGLDQLKTRAKASPLPPADLKIETATAIAAKKQAEFESSNPQLALWMRIKRAWRIPTARRISTMS